MPSNKDYICTFGSLFNHGAFCPNDSLDASGTVVPFGSLLIDGAYNLFGSLDAKGTLVSCDSLAGCVAF